MDIAPSLLERLLSPVGPIEFARTYWGQRPLHVPGSAEKARVIDYGVDDFWRTVEMPGSTIVAQFHGNKGHHEIIDLPGDRGAELFASGMTIVINNLEDHHPGMLQIASESKLVLGYPGSVSVSAFLSPDTGGYGLHFDQHGALALQLQGSKRWSHSAAPAVDSPVRNLVGRGPDLANYNAEWPLLSCELPASDSLVETVLDPGALLYLPPGTWHRPVAEGVSLAITLVFQASRFHALLEHALQVKLYEQRGWRSLLPLAPESTWPSVGLPDDVDRFFAERLAELRAALATTTSADLALAWRQMISDARVKARASTPTEIRRETTIRLTRPLWYGASVRTPGTLRVHSAHQVLFFPDSAESLLQELCKRQTNAAGALFESQDALDWEETATVLSVLCEADFARATST